MLKLFAISSDEMPTIYVKAKTKLLALRLFKSRGFLKDTYAQLSRHPSFKVMELSLQEFFDKLPDEFSIMTKTSF